MSEQKPELPEELLKQAKKLYQLEEEARQLYDELCWGNRKDVGIKFPRTPLTHEEYREKSKAYHDEEWVRLKGVEAWLRDRVVVDKQKLQQLKNHVKNYPMKRSTIVRGEYVELSPCDNEKQWLKQLIQYFEELEGLQNG